jgi:O-antigen/teichoic acid export membrane protein
MGQVIRQALSNSFLIYTGTFVGYINVVLLFPSFFGADQFGLTRALLSFSGLLAILCQFGFSNVILKYYPYFKNKPQKKATFLFTALCTPLLLFIILSVFLYFFQSGLILLFEENSTLFVDYYYLVFPLAFFQLYFQILSAYSRTLLRSVLPIALQDIGVRISVTILILTTEFKLINFETFIYFFIILHSIPSIGILISNFKEFSLNINLKNLNRHEFISIFSFSFYNYLNIASGNLTRRVDVLMLTSLAGLKEVGIYTIAFFIGSFIGTVSKGLRQISTPFIANAFAQNDLTKINELNKKISINQLLTGGFVFVLIFLNVNEILKIINENYTSASLVVLFIGFSRLFMTSAGATTQLINYSKFYRFNLVFKTFQLLILIVLNYIFIKSMGIIGAGLATMIAFVTEATLKIFFTWYKLRFQPYSIKTFKAAFILGICLLSGLLLPEIAVQSFHFKINLLLSIALESFIVLGIFISQLLLLKPSDDLDNLIKKYTPF